MMVAVVVTLCKSESREINKMLKSTQNMVQNFEMHLSLSKNNLQWKVKKVHFFLLHFSSSFSYFFQHFLLDKIPLTNIFSTSTGQNRNLIEILSKVTDFFRIEFRFLYSFLRNIFSWFFENYLYIVLYLTLTMYNEPLIK